MIFSDPAYGSSQIVNTIDAGVYQAIGLNLGRISQGQLTNLKADLEATKNKLENQNFTALTKDELIGDLLYTTALAYHAELGATNYIAAKVIGVRAITVPSETIFASKLNVLTLWGMPRFVRPGGLNMDADYLMQVVKPKNGNNEKVIQYMLSSGMASSALEHSVPEEYFSTLDHPAEGVSTVKALQLANAQGIPIYTVNQSNLSTVLPQLQVDSYVKADILNAVNSGKVVTVSKTNINFHGWLGCGYIITNPETGAGAYMISGGMNGSWFDYFWSFLDTLFLSLDAGANTVMKLFGKIIEVECREVLETQIKKIGILGIVVQSFYDINSISSLDGGKYTAAFINVIFWNACIALALLASPAGLIATILLTALLSIVANMMKNLIYLHIANDY